MKTLWSVCSVMLLCVFLLTPVTMATDTSGETTALEPPSQQECAWKDSLCRGWEATKSAMQTAGQKTANFFVKVGQGIGCVVLGVVVGPCILWHLKNFMPPL